MINHQQRLAGRLGLCALALGWVSPGSVRGQANPKPRARVAMTSSLPSAGAAIRQRAFDGSAATAFRSVAPAKAGDHLTLTFDAPVSVRGVAVTTGTDAGGEALSAGTIEVSPDGATFAPVATCDVRGAARVEFAERPVRAVRVRVTRNLAHPLVVREVEITSNQVGPFRHPVEVTVACPDAPELRPWTEAAARLCEQWYDSLHVAIGADAVRSADRVTLTMFRDYKYRGVAEAGGSQIVASGPWFEAHPDDQGALIHETIHIIQQYPFTGTARAPTWLIEGLDDYIRFFVYEPGKAGPIPPQRAQYDGSYRVTATFLDYLVRTYDKDLIPKLDRVLRMGTYKPSFFRLATGKSAPVLSDEWRRSLGIAAAARPAGSVSRDPGKPTGVIEGDAKGTAFQDKARGRLARVIVHGGWWIDSIVCTWTDAQGEEDEGSAHGGIGGEDHVLTLEPGESLVQVAGVVRADGTATVRGDRDTFRIGQAVVGSLTFKTTKRTIGPFGETTQGRKFTLDAPRGQEICGLRGRAGQYLNAVGIVCRPLP